MRTIDEKRGGSAALRSRIANHETLIGTFVKTTSHQTVEVLGESGLDLLVLDAEHAPFDRQSLDLCSLAARASGIPIMVRTASASPHHILQALDAGAQGVLVPHIDTPDAAEAVVKASRYRENQGERGFSNSPRAGRYGRVPLKQHTADSDRNIALVVQIESRRAVDSLSEILSVPGIDAVFVGRADLAVSYGADDLDHPAIQAGVATIAEQANAENIPLGIFLPNGSEIPRFHAMGFRFFVLGSDQSLLLHAANALAGPAHGRE